MRARTPVDDLEVVVRSNARILKILYVLQPRDMGSATHVKALVAWACRAGHEVHIVCDPRLEGLDFVREHATVWPRKLSRNPSPRDVTHIAYIARLIRRERFDLVHAHSSKAGALSRLAAKLSAGNTPVVYSPHGYPFRNEGLGRVARRLFWLVERLLGPLTDGVVALHQEEEADAKRTARAAKVYRTRNGVTLPERRAPASPAFVIAYVGRLVRTKGVDVLLGALPRFFQEEPSAEAWIVGDGQERSALQEQVRRLGLDRRVRFLGARDDLVDLWSSIDVLVLPSRWDVQPFVLAEGMAAGRAIVATRVGGIPEVVDNGVNGLLVPPEQPEELAGALVQMAHRPSFRRRLMDNAQRTAPSPDAMFADHQSIYDELVGGRS